MSDANKPSKETPDQPQPKANNQSVLIGGIAGLIAAIAALVTAFGGADGIIKILRESDISKPELSPTPTTSNTVVPTPNLESPKATPKTSPNQQSEETPLSPSYNTQGNGRYVVSEDVLKVRFPVILTTKVVTTNLKIWMNKAILWGL